MRTDYFEIIKELKEDFTNQANGLVTGYTTGFDEVDRRTSRMENGQVWTIGGYTGSGKSFVIFNMIDQILKKEVKPRVIVFSTELTAKQYVKRHLFMRAGLWKLEFDNAPKTHLNSILKEADKYFNERLQNDLTLNIHGDITSLEQIEEQMEQYMEYFSSPKMIFIDYVQELSVEGKYDERDTMPLIGAKLKALAIKYNCVIVAVSQVNQGSLQDDVKTQTRLPFSFGKQLNQASYTSITLSREKFEGELFPILNMHILKARDGEIGTVNFKIDKGYVITPIKEVEVKKIKEEFKSKIERKLAQEEKELDFMR